MLRSHVNGYKLENYVHSLTKPNCVKQKGYGSFLPLENSTIILEYLELSVVPLLLRGKQLRPQVTIRPAFPLLTAVGFFHTRARSTQIGVTYKLYRYIVIANNLLEFF